MLGNRKRLAVLLGAGAAVLAVAGLNFAQTDAPSDTEAALAATKARVAARWPGLPHISVSEASAKIESGNVVLFDVRTPEEFAVSRLPGARRIEPGMSARNFLDRYGNEAAGKAVLFYCAVGARSSTMATKVADQLKAQGATGVYDLAGGIFAWHSERGRLVNDGGATDYVHPYDEKWGRLLVRSGLMRMTPD